jgi:hypothetical protein
LFPRAAGTGLNLTAVLAAPGENLQQDLGLAAIDNLSAPRITDIDHPGAHMSGFWPGDLQVNS